MSGKKLFVVLIMFVTVQAVGQPAMKKTLRAFPITDYVVALNDSMKVVQVNLPAGPVLDEGQLGLLRPRINITGADTAMIGWGKCRLIKGDYYYFNINQTNIARPPAINDLLYTLVSVPAENYADRIAGVAAHAIQLQDVYETSLYDPLLVFSDWSAAQEKRAIDSMAADVRYTGAYFLANDASMNKEIIKGKYKGQKVLSVMVACQPADVKDFLDYVIARPRLFAGHSWKLSEVFATWASEGAPMVVKN